MKKLIITSIFAVTCASTVSANSGDIHFLGSVTDTTCEITPEVDGVARNTIDLGVMKTDGTGSTAVAFSLKPTGATAAACLAKTDGASIGWQSAAFDNAGIANQGGSATGASIELVAVNAATPNQKVTAGNQNVEYASGAAIPSFNYTAKLVKTGAAAATPGSVLASASYTVAYR